jgi:FkbM family methyltransferase
MTDTQLHTLSIYDKNIQILVNRAVEDDISSAIRRGVYPFPPGFQLLLDLAPAGQRVLDLGAHIGTFSLFAAAHGYEVAAVEASAYNASLLRQSVAANRFERIQVINKAISNQPEVIEFIEAGPYGVVANPSVHAPTTSVEAITGDALLASLGWQDVAFVKMDIEGSEVKGVAGMKGLLSRPDAPILLFESNSYTLKFFDETPARLLAALKKLGYRCYLVEPGQLIPVQPWHVQTQCTVDYLAVKQRLPPLKGWQIQKPLSYHKMAERITTTCVDPQEHERAHIGRALAQASSLLADPQVQHAVETLSKDPSETVRNAVSWWQGARAGNFIQRRYHRLKYALQTRVLST